MYKVFTLPLFDGTEAEESLNRFLDSHKVISVDKQLVEHQGGCCWTFLVEYEDEKAEPAAPSSRPVAVDYRQRLSSGEYELFSRLRALRKQLAEENGVPPYAVATNEQLEQMIKRPVKNSAELLKIPGMGEGKVSRYGEQLLRVLHQNEPELPSDARN